MAILKILLMSLLLASPTFAASNHDEPIAIIGAGASGLTAAFRLREQGYSNVTVFEKDSRVGGKVYSFPYEGEIYEMGAFWAGNQYKIIDELAEKYGITFSPEEANFLVKVKDGSEYTMDTFLNKIFNQWQFATGYFQWSKVLNKYKALKDPDAFLKLKDADLYLPFGEFIKKYKIEVFAAGFRPFWIGCGYGYYETTPAIYVLKLMVDVFNISPWGIIKSYLPWAKDNNEGNGLRRVDQGYQEIWNRVADDLGNVKLNTFVEKVERIKTDDGYSIQVTANGTTETFSKLIVATDLQAARKFLDTNDQESELFGQVINYNYYINLVDADIPYSGSTMLFLDEYGFQSTIGHMTALVNRSYSPNIWTTGQLLSWDSSVDELNEYLFNDFRDLGSSTENIVEQKQWTYFPHVNSKSLQNGFYSKLGALQGQKNTYYVGGILNFETVEHTAAYAQFLVKKHF